MIENPKTDAIIQRLIHDLNKPFVLITLDNHNSHVAKVFSFDLSHEELIKLLDDSKHLLQSGNFQNGCNCN